VLVNRNRLYLLGAAAVAAAVVVGVVIAVASKGGSSATTTTVAPTTSSTPTSPSAGTDLLAGIPQKGATLGRASAPVTVQVFEDPQCPFCQEWNVGTLPTVVRDYVRIGQIKLVYRGIQIIGPNSEQGLRASYAAGSQNRLWQMVDALYARQGTENSGWIDDAVVASAAKAAGVNVKKLSAAFLSAPVNAELKSAERAAVTYAVQGTPTFVVEHPPAQPTQLQLAGLDPSSFAAALAPLLK
jgi:protein-disulfide isomerase